MFETQQFKDQLKTAISSEAGRNSMNEYQTAIVDYLFDFARTNEPELMRVEFTKAVSERRGIPDALESARTIVRDASAIARNNNRIVLTRADVEIAYKAKFCRVWPFCK